MVRHFKYIAAFNKTSWLSQFNKKWNMIGHFFLVLNGNYCTVLIPSVTFSDGEINSNRFSRTQHNGRKAFEKFASKTRHFIDAYSKMKNGHGTLIFVCCLVLALRFQRSFYAFTFFPFFQSTSTHQSRLSQTYDWRWAIRVGSPLERGWTFNLVITKLILFVLTI